MKKSIIFDGTNLPEVTMLIGSVIQGKLIVIYDEGAKPGSQIIQKQNDLVKVTMSIGMKVTAEAGYKVSFERHWYAKTPSRTLRGMSSIRNWFLRTLGKSPSS